MRHQDLGYVLGEFGEVVSKFRTSWDEGFELKLSNGRPPSDLSPTAKIFAPAVGTIMSHAPTVAEGVQELMIELHSRLGTRLDDGYLFKMPVEAFGQLMEELAVIGAPMSDPKKRVRVGRNRGPFLSLELRALPQEPNAVLFFGNLGEGYKDPNFRHSNSIFFRGPSETVLDALDKVVAQARGHLERNSSWPQRSWFQLHWALRRR